MVQGTTGSDEMEIELFSYSGWDQNDNHSEQYYNCVFKKDFGPFTQGETCNCIEINVCEGTLIEYDTEGNKLRQLKLTFAIKED